ncbi:MAG: site-specific integrase [Nannocystaceae bacterium]
MALTQRVVEGARPRADRYWLWDDQVKGFGCRISPAGRRTYYVKYRTLTGTQRRMKLGDHGILSLRQARDQAKETLAAVRRGEDPAHARQEGRTAPTVAELGDRFLREHARVHKKPSSVRMDETNLERHVLPRIGARKVAEVRHTEIVRLHQSIGAKTPGAANRVLALLSKMFNLAEKWGVRGPGTNPCRHVVKFKERKVERYVAPDEYARLISVIAETLGDGKLPGVGALALRLLMTTGCRLGEILGLQWRDVDLDRGELILRDAKTGGRHVPLSDHAIELLREHVATVDRRSIGWVLPRPGREAEPLTAAWMWCRWRWIRRDAGVPDLRIHDLRHGFASVGAAQGLTLFEIGALLGHTTPATTARYTHLVNDPLKRAASKIAVSIHGAGMKAEKDASGVTTVDAAT